MTVLPSKIINTGLSQPSQTHWNFISGGYTETEIVPVLRFSWTLISVSNRKLHRVIFHLDYMDRLHSAIPDSKGKWPTCDFHLNTWITICQHYRDNHKFLHYSLKHICSILLQLQTVESKNIQVIFSDPSNYCISVYTVGNLTFSVSSILFFNGFSTSVKFLGKY